MDNYEFHWNVVFDAFPQLLSGAFTTVHVSVLSMLVGIIIAVLLALGKNVRNQSFLSCCKYLDRNRKEYPRPFSYLYGLFWFRSLWHTS